MSVARDRIRRRAVESLMSTRKSFISLLSVLVFAGCSAVDSLDFYWQGGFEPVIDSRFPLADAAGAQARMESGEAAGKILLLP